MRHLRPLRAVLRNALAAVLAVPVCLMGTAAVAYAQPSWDATLFVMPFPSPYLSDWETNPTIASLTILNGGSQAQDVILYSEVRNQAGTVVSAGRSDPQTIAPGVPAVYNDLTEIAGTQEHDQAIEDLVRRSGRLPEGDYTACVAVTDLGGFVLARACADFTILYPDPPMLIAPADGDVVTSMAPVLQWTPLQVPPAFTLQYVLQVAELLPGQIPEAALSSNILHYENLDVGGTSLAYPVDGLPLESGKTYAWRVVAMDQNGYAASTNGGSSEIWTFTYDDGSGVGETLPTSSAIMLSLFSDPGNPRGSPPPDEVTGLLQICSEWDRPASRTTQISLPILPWLVFPGALENPASLVRQELPGGHRVWAVVGNRSMEYPAVLLYGDCDGPFNRSVLRWIGVRRMAETQELGAWLAGTPSTDLPEDVEGQGLLKFGVGIFSFYGMTVTGDSLEPVDAFLEGNSFDVRPGLNLFGLLDGDDTSTRLGKVLGAIAAGLHTTSNDFEVSGFVGLDNSFSLGGAIGGGDGRGVEGGVDGSVETTFLVLRAAAPPWKKPWDADRVESVQLAVEFVIKDSAFAASSYSSGAGSDARREIAWDVVPSLNLTVVTADGVTWNGSLGIDFTNLQALETDFKLVVKLSTDHQWQPGPLAGTNWYLGNPEIELDIENLKEFIDANEQWSLLISGSLGWGNETSIAKVGVTIGRKERDATLNEMIERDSLIAHDDSARIAGIRETLRVAEEQDDTESMARYRNALKDEERKQQQRLTNLATLRTERRFHAGAKPRPNAGIFKPGSPAADPGKRDTWFWRARVAFGNMSLLDLLDLIRKATGGSP